MSSAWRRSLRMVLVLLLVVWLPTACSGGSGDRVVLMLDYESGFGGAVYPVYNPYVFFADGSVVKAPKPALADLDRSARNPDQGRWGRWQLVGEKVQITWDQRNRRGEVQTSEQDWPGLDAVPAARNERLEGSWRSLGGGGNLAMGGTVGIVNTSRFTFAADGRFTTERLSGGGSSTDFAGSSASNSAFARRDSAGTYALDGHTLNLHFNNGESRRLFFCFLGKDRKTLRIGGSNYTPASR